MGPLRSTWSRVFCFRGIFARPIRSRNSSDDRLFILVVDDEGLEPVGRFVAPAVGVLAVSVRMAEAEVAAVARRGIDYPKLAREPADRHAERARLGHKGPSGRPVGECVSFKSYHKTNVLQLRQYLPVARSQTISFMQSMLVRASSSLPFLSSPLLDRLTS